MRSRPRDKNGDIMPVTRKQAMLTGTDAVAQNISDALHLLQGEWWENDEIGFEVPKFLYNGVRASSGVEMLTSYISAYVGAVDGVTDVQDVTGEMNQRKYTYECTVDTDFGSTRGELTDALLYSIY